jgi:hypothetical protein
MKRAILPIVSGLILFLMIAGFTPGDKSTRPAGDYIVIAWNDLGMHCANQDFTNMCILPPYNNQFAHIILKGTSTSPPTVMPASSGFYVTYEIPGNTYSVGKTNFWDYAQHLFGVTLQPNIGLTGLGLTGTMLDSLNYHYAIGIPITPYTDAAPTTESPFQLTLMKAYDAGGNLVASTQDVIPVSGEISCVSSGCHSSEMNILNEHENVPGFNIANKPILCANCHSDNALGMPGTPGVPPFSQVIHQQHGFISDCYKCHPGPNTQCFRDVMHTGGMECQDCHGSVSNVGNTIENGRNPWLEEPSCGATQCHGSNYAEEPGKLFRQSKGHGDLFCSTCHGSPHAILPSEQANDNVQNITLQGYAGILRECSVCHGYTPSGPGPHGFNPMGIKPVTGNIPSLNEIMPNYPNPFTWMTNIPFNIASDGLVALTVIDMRGNIVKTLVNEPLKAGEYKAELYSTGMPAGMYLCKLESNGTIRTAKVILIK